MAAERIDLLAPKFRNGEWATLATSSPRDLTRDEFAAALPPRGARGSVENVIRFARMKILKIMGFTVDGNTIDLLV